LGNLVSYFETSVKYFPEIENPLHIATKSSSSEGGIAAIDVLFSDHPKCLDLIFIYLSGA